MTLEIIGRLLICGMIIGSIVLFTVANVNYLPEQDKKDIEE